MLTDKKIMPPPWIAFPEIERYSIGWRMGYGEGYLYDEWGPWYHALSEDDVQAYQELFPEPVTWRGYWNLNDEGSCYRRNEFETELWREKGIPKYSVEQIRKEFSQGTKLKYTMFWKPDPSSDGSLSESVLSQWWKSDFWAVAHTYCCMEQFMMAGKALLFGDKEIREQILQCSDPRQIMTLGRKVRHFDQVVWDEVKYSIVLNGNYHKFSQNPGLRSFLLSTGDSVLVEASPFDGIWGIKMGQADEHVLNPLKWCGENLLGFALMEVRDEIRRVWKNADMCEAVEA